MPATRIRRDDRGRHVRPAAPRGAWVGGAVVAVIVAAAAGAWFLGRRDLAADLVARQRELMATSDRLTSADLDALVRDVDRLSREEARTVRAALGAEWQRLKRESVDRYFAAPSAERPALLDDDIARLRKYHRLLASLNPMDTPGGPVRAPRGPRPSRDAGQPPEVAEAERARRELVELYDAARAARAKERGITLPEFR